MVVATHVENGDKLGVFPVCSFKLAFVQFYQCCSIVAGSLTIVVRWSSHLAKMSYFISTIVLLSRTSSCFGWLTVCPQSTLIFWLKSFWAIRVCKCQKFNFFYQLTFIFEFSASLSQKLTACSISGLSRRCSCWVLFLPELPFLISSSIPTMFPSN